MSGESRVRTQVRDRTRTAILAAAAATWAWNRKATLEEIAVRAGVGRSTIHRYFANREQLLNATVENSVHVIEAAVDEAKLEQGAPRDGLRRLVAALVDMGDRIVFLFSDLDTIQRLENLGLAQSTDDPVLELIRRGQSEGIFDDAVDPSWIQSVLWALIYTGIEKAKDGTLLRHDIVPTVMRTLETGILREPPASPS